MSQASPAQTVATTVPTGDAEVPAAPATPATTALEDAPATTAPPAIQIGQTIDQVEAALGAPTRIAHQKSGTVFYYNGKNITFKDGKVTKVE